MCLLGKRGNLVQYQLDLDPPPKVIFFEIEGRSVLQLNFIGKSNSKWFKGEDEPKPRPATETPAPAWKPEVFYYSLYEKKLAGSHLQVNLGKASKKNRFFLGKSPKLWVGGGQESYLVKM